MTVNDVTPQKSLVLVFNSESNEDANFWETYKSSVQQFIKNRYTSGDIRYVLPFSHPKLKHPDSDKTWTNSIIIGLNSNNNYKLIAKDIVTHLQKSEVSSAFKSADVMQLHKGLDMFYAIKNGIDDEDQLNQIVEYVFSDLKGRQTYYKEQTLFSGPAMAELHRNDMAGRFIGFELEERLFGKDFPQWDIIHVVGFTEAQTKKATPVFYSIWDKHAERVFGKGMTFLKKKSQWDTLRLNIKSNATQQMNLSFALFSKTTNNN